MRIAGEKTSVNLFVNGDYEYVVFFQGNELGQWDDSGSSSGHVDQAHMDAQG